ncbi:MAG: glycosyltransferase family 2 protein [Betaproteobacteria bacterium]|nr:glycosyltransferase family 2 protein [Betaproteobacteria bacterium]
MADIAISIVIPTLGRKTLKATLGSIELAGFDARDEVIVVWGDGGAPDDALRAVRVPCETRVFKAMARPKPDYGNTQKTVGMRNAKGTHIAFMDDDDVYAPGAAQRIRDALTKNPGLPHQFQVMLGKPHCRPIWTKRRVEHGNITSIGLVVPNDPGCPGWPVRRPDGWLTPWNGTGNDVVFAQACDSYFKGFVFCEDIIALWRPESAA